MQDLSKEEHPIPGSGSFHDAHDLGMHREPCKSADEGDREAELAGVLTVWAMALEPDDISMMPLSIAVMPAPVRLSGSMAESIWREAE